ncbi:metallopeptidase, SprT family [Enterococcus faecalis 13-SD-W-01]|nr:metallopeptidase, SprT family [Enterococcus faecalis 13-SD-W-01]
MDQKQLQELVEEISLRYFGQPFMHQAAFNNRLKTTGGRYHLKEHHLDFNPHLFAESSRETVVGIIKHELCHYHLHLAGKGYRHKDQDFKRLLAKTGGLRYAPSLSPTKIECYQCQDCGTLIQRRNKLNTKKYFCGKCRGSLVWRETQRRAG